MYLCAHGTCFYNYIQVTIMWTTKKGKIKGIKHFKVWGLTNIFNIWVVHSTTSLIIITSMHSTNAKLIIFLAIAHHVSFDSYMTRKIT